MSRRIWWARGAIAVGLSAAGSMVGATSPANAAGTGFSTSGSTVTVTTCGYTALEAALAAAPVGGTVDFACSGTINFNGRAPLYLFQSVTLDGAGQHVILDGDQQGQIAYTGGTGPVTVENLTFMDGSTANAPFLGGGAVTNMGTTTLAGDSFVDNHSYNNGGAIWNKGAGGTLTIVNSTFTDNAVTCSITGVGGGAIEQNARGPLVIRGSTFSGNTTNGRAAGGAIYAPPAPSVDSGSITVSDSTFTDNQADFAQNVIYSSSYGVQGGGAINDWGHPLTVSGSTFSSNQAAISGGAITLTYWTYSPDSTATVTASTFTGNEALETSNRLGSTTSVALGSGLGGAISDAGIPLTLDTSTLRSNFATWNGGAVYGGPVSVTGSTVEGNTTNSADSLVTDAVGGLDAASRVLGFEPNPYSPPTYVTVPGSITVADSIVESNDSPLPGGGAVTGVVNCGVDTSALTGAASTAAKIIDGGGNTESPGHTCGFSHAPAVTSQPEDATITLGASATFTAAAAGGYPAPSAMWQESSDGGATWTAVTSGPATTDAASGVTTTSLTVAPGTVTDSTSYRAVFANATSTATTAPALLVAGTAPVITSAPTAAFVAGRQGGATLTSSGFPAATITCSGQLPPGLALTAGGKGSATLSGTPTQAGTYHLTLSAANEVGNAATQDLTVVVVPTPAIVTPTALPGGAAGGTYRLQLSATGGLGGYSWTVAPGSTLPPGLTLSPNGLLSGVPTELGTFTFTVSAGDLTTKALTLTTVAARKIAVAATTPPEATPPAALAFTGIDAALSLGAAVLLVAIGTGVLVLSQFPMGTRGRRR